MTPISNFDFLMGKWAIENKRLKERLCGCDEWTEFPAIMETHSIMNGMGTMDEFKTSSFGEEFVGLSIRLYNPQKDEWTIYWADTFSPEKKLMEQVAGQFKDGVGEFYGTELFNGKPVKLRFLWKLKSVNMAVWEQAYFDEKNKVWETNWVMEFSRIK